MAPYIYKWIQETNRFHPGVAKVVRHLSRFNFNTQNCCRAIFLLQEVDTEWYSVVSNFIIIINGTFEFLQMWWIAASGGDVLPKNAI
jgi:hypothetical protein